MSRSASAALVAAALVAAALVAAGGGLYAYNVNVNASVIGSHLDSAVIVLYVTVCYDGITDIKSAYTASHINGVYEHFGISVGKIHVFIVIAVVLADRSYLSLYVKGICRGFSAGKGQASTVRIRRADGRVLRAVIYLRLCVAIVATRYRGILLTTVFTRIAVIIIGIVRRGRFRIRVRILSCGCSRSCGCGCGVIRIIQKWNIARDQHRKHKTQR